jgi:cellulose synthase/poly-beta-1,6-N-acetylglucosamine synthase-like glycosyltransferase
MPASDDVAVVFMIPCLNEAAVIGATLDGLLALPGAHGILVIDDGSDDETAAIVGSYGRDRVQLLRRELPNAREGKGAALNAGFRYLQTSSLIEGRDPADVIVAVFDADGRIDPTALSMVGGFFRDPKAGAVQIRVDIRNAETNLLARLQDMEFAVFTEIFQRARQKLGSVGLGGNGQFVRLSALESLGEPWSDCLTEDLDLGVRLLLAGWTNHYCPTASVDQQGVTSLRRWFKQRSRWFQGHLQCWKLIPRILRSQLPAASCSDITWYLLMPCWLLLIPLVSFPMLIGFAIMCITQPGKALDVLGAGHGLVALTVYGFMFGPAYLGAFVYWLHGRVSFVRAILLAHAFEVYANLWVVAGWMAVFRVLRRQRGWTKTARVAEPDPANAA